MTIGRADVDVVVPVYNGALHLAETLDSILGQTLLPNNVVVVDDGSTDDTASVAERFSGRVRLGRQAHGGAAQARNTGVQSAQSAYLAFLDADDLWMPDKLARQMAALCRFDGPAMAFGHVVQFASPELLPDEVARLRFDATPRPGISASGLLMRMEDFHVAGPFDARLRTGEFVEWYGRAQAAGLATRVVPEVVFRRRLHRGNHGRTQPDARLDYAHALKAVLDRRRENR